MATVAEPREKPAEGELRFMIYNVGWERYETLIKLFDDRPLRIAYSKGNVELMSPLIIHEFYKKRLAYIVEAITDELEIPRFPVASTTFRRRELDRGLESDESYYLSRIDQIRDPGYIDINVDPAPDLAIEIDITSSSLDRLEIYAKMGFPEIWRFDGEALSVLLLGDDRTYRDSETSAAFPFLPMDVIAEFLMDMDRMDESRWGRSFRAWVREVLMPRYQAGDEPGDEPR